jgi:hypothetical protein
MNTYIEDNKVGKYIVFQGMELGKPLTLWSVTGSSFSESQSGTSGLLSRLGISQHPRSSSSSGQKRKRHRETSSAQPKRSRSKSSRRRLDITDLIKEDDRPEEASRYSVEQPSATSLWVSHGQAKDHWTIEYCPVWSFPLQDGRPMNLSLLSPWKRVVILSGRIDLSIKTEISFIVAFRRTMSSLRKRRKRENRKDY